LKELSRSGMIGQADIENMEQILSNYLPKNMSNVDSDELIILARQARRRKV
jgi:hypothetical protein